MANNPFEAAKVPVHEEGTCAACIRGIGCEAKGEARGHRDGAQAGISAMLEELSKREWRVGVEGAAIGREMVLIDLDRIREMVQAAGFTTALGEKGGS